MRNTQIGTYLTLVDELQVHNGKRNVLHVRCMCICGNTKIIRKHDYLRGMVVSCGCMTGTIIKEKHLREIPIDTVFGSLRIVNRTEERSTEGYKYLCSCSCGNTIEVYANRLKREETKSCGCKSSYYNSVNNGGNGIAYSKLPLQEAIRCCEKYQRFIKACLIRANGKSELSGEAGQKLHVHHLDSVSYLIKKHELTLDSYLECEELFSMNNAIVLTETEHRNFHSLYNKTTTVSDWNSYKQNELIVVV